MYIMKRQYISDFFHGAKCKRSDKPFSEPIETEVNNGASASTNTNMANADSLPADDGDIVSSSNPPLSINQGKEELIQFQPTDLKFPKTLISGVHRSFKAEWFKTWPWLHWDIESNSAKCFPCLKAKKLYLKLMTKCKVDDAFTVVGFVNWKKATERFKQHEKSDFHGESLKALANYNDTPVIAKVSAQAKMQMESSKKALLAIISSIKYLTYRGLALRGDMDKEGNLFELLQLRSNEIPEMKDWLGKKRNWLSHDIQNEVLQLLAFDVIDNIEKHIKVSQYYSLIVDETTDISTNIIFDVLLRLDIPLENCRGQCYDGASNMKGYMNGAQAIVKEKESRATYIHCFNHFLNLAIVDGTEAVPEFSAVLENVHSLAKFFKESPKRTNICIQYKAEEDPSLVKNKKLKPLCPTRWTVRYKSLKSVSEQYEQILSVLDSLKFEEAVASGLLSFFEKTTSLFYLELSSLVFCISEELAKKLQMAGVSISYAMAEVKRVQKKLEELRTEFKFSELLAKVKKRAEDMDLEPLSLPRIRRPPKRFEQTITPTPPSSFSCPEDLLRKRYFAVLDNFTGEIESRFQHPGVAIYNKMETLLLRSAQGRNEEVTEELHVIVNHFKNDLSLEKLQRQLPLLPDLIGDKTVEELQDLINIMRDQPPQTRRLLSEIMALIKLLLVLPAFSATAERTFSNLRRLKTWLRSTMSQKRLNHLSVLSVHRDIAKNISDLAIAKQFISNVSSRTTIFGNIQ